ncbi:MAG TPA: hypothetical protein H9740_01495 [Candidatus Hungatella pullicola]|nr:hypothetical protein [Candidatus Hungatella pullicola]
MARGVRKSPREKLEQKLAGVQEAIAQYRECLKTLEAQEKEIVAELEKEDLRELSAVLKECSVTADEVKQIILDYTSTEQKGA